MFVKIMPVGPKLDLLGGHMLCIGLYRDNMINLFVRDHKGSNLDIMYVASPSRPLLSLFK